MLVLQLPLLALVPIALASFGLFARREHRGHLFALAVASAPLILLVWANLAAVGQLVSGPTVGTLTEAELVTKLAWLIGAGLVPAALAWGLLWRAPEACPCPRMPLRPLEKVSGGAAATLGVLALVGVGLSLASSGEGSSASLGTEVWSQATPWLVVALSLAAGLAEELLFRGVLYSSLAPWLGFVGGGIVQAGIFGIVHLGYGSLVYAAAAAAFGLLQAYVSVRWGLLVAVMVHTQVNVVVLGWVSRSSFEANGLLAVGVLAVNLLLVLPGAGACLFSKAGRCPLDASDLGLPEPSKAAANPT